jgi:P-aminobenzoate N-oxygenase AurF
MSTYSFAKCLENAYKVNWKIDDVVGGKRFDAARRWLPETLSGASGLASLDAELRRRLTHVEMAAYAHLFGYVEEFIAPKVAGLAKGYAIDQRVAFDALTNFAAEEVKHMNLFRRVRDEINETMGFDLALLGGQAETARFVLSKSTGAVLLLTACIEWFTQRHYVDAFQDDGPLDPLTKEIFRAHWLEESQHARMDHIETVRAFAAMTDEERERAVEELIELVAAVDGLLQTQTDCDVANLETYLARALEPAEREQVRDEVLRAKRWTFIESGVTHPRFQELLVEVTTPAQRERIGAALQGLLAPAGAAA